MDEEGFHVLPPDVEDKRDVGTEVAGCRVVGDGFDDAVVQTKGGLDEVFAVARRTAARDDGVGARAVAGFGKEREAPLHGGHGVALVGVIVGKNNLVAAVEHHHFGGGGARVDAERHLFAPRAQGPLADAAAADAAAPAAMVGFVVEDGRQASRRGAGGGRAGLGEGGQRREARGRCGVGRKGGAPRRDEVGVLGQDDVGGRKVEIVGKSLAQGAKERQRAAAEKEGRRDVAAVGQRDHRLHGHGVEDGGGNVGAPRVFGDEVLDVGLAEDAAARGDGIDVAGAAGQLVQLPDGHAQQHGHLVDKGARAARAVAVHAQIGGLAVAEKDHFGVLAADVDERGHRAVAAADIVGGGHDFLNERQAARFGNAHAHRAGDVGHNAHVAHGSAGLGQQCRQRFAHLGVVAFVA